MSKDSIAFEGERVVTSTRGTKLEKKRDPHKELLQSQKNDFEKKADELFTNKEEQKDRGIEITKNYFQAIRDKTLLSNRSVIINNFEKDLRKDIQEYILHLNNDPSEHYDGMGSLTGLSLVFKTLFEMRDRINELEYQLKQYKLSSPGESGGK